MPGPWTTTTATIPILAAQYGKDSTVLSGVITGITVTSGGSGYVNPTLAVAGDYGTGFVGLISLSGGVISGVTIVNPGYGYLNPIGAFSDITGTGAAVSITASDIAENAWPARWTVNLQNSINIAADIITSVFASKGYSSGQIDSWAPVASYNQSFAVDLMNVWINQQMGREGVDTNNADVIMKWQKVFQSITLTIAGVDQQIQGNSPVSEGLGAGNQIGCGAILSDANLRFSGGIFRGGMPRDPYGYWG